MRIIGIDTLEFGIDVENYDETFGNILIELEKMKLLAQTEYKEQIFELNNLKFVVNRKGQGFYSYKIETKQFYICFMSHYINKNSPIFVRFMSEFLWQYGYEKAFDNFMEWFNKLNVKIIGTRISRLDICLDIDEIDFFKEDIDKFVTKANKVARHYVDSDYYENKDFSGLTIGRGGLISCRIYDKTLEIKKSQKKWFEEIWKNNGWDNMKNVWRIEFQIRRKALKEFNINSVLDIKQQITELWGYLTQKWLVMKKKCKDSNISRWKTHNKWIKVQQAENNFLPIVGLRNVINKGNLETLFNSCIGSMVSIAAINNNEKISDTYLEIVEYMNEKNSKNNTTFKEEVIKRKRKFI